MRINIGCGTDWRSGYVNIDCEPWEKVRERAEAQGLGTFLLEGATFLCADVREGLPFADDTVTEAIANEFLEHLASTELWWFLRDLRRAMSEGGTFAGTTPDIEATFALYVERSQCEWDAEATSGIFAEPWENYLHNMAHGWGHRCIFTAPMLQHVLTDAGFAATVTREAPNRLRFQCRAGGAP